MSKTQKIVIWLPSILLLFLLLYIGVYFGYYLPKNEKISSFRTSPIIKNEQIFPGFTLIAPYNRSLNKEQSTKGSVYLLDLHGNSIHRWSTPRQPFYAVIKKNSNLITMMEAEKYSQFYPPGGNTGTLLELDWDGNVVWKYENERMHHDIAQTDNDTLAVILWEKTPKFIAKQIQGGVDGTEVDGEIWSDEIREIDRNGKTLWSWHSYEHLDPQIDTIGELLPRFAWTHTNGIEYMAKNPIDGEPGYLLSMRSINTILMVRKRDGRIIWRSPKNMLNTQHDPTLLENGNILVFDNGQTRIPSPFSIYGSRVVELNPLTNEIVWSFDGGEGAIDKARFYSAIVGGAQRLSNGNTLISDGLRGHIFEVNSKKEVVWDIVSPLLTVQTGNFPNNFIFKSRRYGENEIDWPASISPSYQKSKILFQSILERIYP